MSFVKRVGEKKAGELQTGRKQKYKQNMVFQYNPNYFINQNVVREFPYTFVGEVSQLILDKHEIKINSLTKKMYKVFEKLTKLGYGVTGCVYVFSSLNRQQLINLYTYIRKEWLFLLRNEYDTMLAELKLDPNDKITSVAYSFYEWTQTQIQFHNHVQYAVNLNTAKLQNYILDEFDHFIDSTGSDELSQKFIAESFHTHFSNI